jgi:ABC-type amino acid transport system permease subunit
MLPELDEARTAFVAASAGRTLPAPELRVYTAALLGFIAFYGLENLVAWSRDRPETEGGGRGWSNPVFLLHVGGFALYAWLVTYLMVRSISDTPLPITMYAIAMGLHFIGVDHSLLREHGAIYLRVGRFVLAAAALAGWSVAMITEISRAAIITSLGLISGGVVMNGMVMELPTEKDGRFWPFVAGAAAYTALLLLIR